MQVDFLHVCNHAFTNSNHQPCLMGVLNLLQAPAFPYCRASLSVAMQLRPEPGSRHNLVIELAPEHGPFLRRAPLSIHPQPVPNLAVLPPLFLSIQMVQVFFPRPGMYIARALEDGQVLASATFEIIGPGQALQPPLSAQVDTDSLD